MTSPKEKMAKIIDAQPDDASYDEISKQLAFEKMVSRGLDDSKEGRVIENEEMKRRIDSWQK